MSWVLIERTYINVHPAVMLSRALQCAQKIRNHLEFLSGSFEGFDSFYQFVNGPS